MSKATMIGIYKIENKKTGKVYIGSSKDVDRRLKSHKRDLRLDKHRNPYLQEEFNEYGRKNFTFEEIEEHERTDDLHIRESYFINKYKDKHGVYNISDPLDEAANIGNRKYTRGEVLYYVEIIETIIPTRLLEHLVEEIKRRGFLYKSLVDDVMIGYIDDKHFNGNIDFMDRVLRSTYRKYGMTTVHMESYLKRVEDYNVNGVIVENQSESHLLVDMEITVKIYNKDKE